MTTKGLFDKLLENTPLFRNKEVMRSSYTPAELPHRSNEINHLGSILVSALRGETPSNIFIYGKTGTGKTAVTRYVGQELTKKGRELARTVEFIYINCQIVDTTYRVLQNIANHFIDDWAHRVPFTGWPTDEVHTTLTRYLEGQRKDAHGKWSTPDGESGGVTVIVLDEVDKLKEDAVLYNLSRLNTELRTGKVCLIGISNDLRYTETLDPRVKSSLGEESMIFAPYNADKLEDILTQRSEMAFTPGVLAPGVLALCAAMAANEDGDARRALDLLRVSAEIAEREQGTVVQDRHVYLARNKIEIDRVKEAVRTLPTQSKLVLLATIIGEEARPNPRVGLTTGDVYDIYRRLCQEGSVDVLTSRRVTDLISELDMLGIISAKVVSKGRYGRTREIQMSCPVESTRIVLEEDDLLRDVSSVRAQRQSLL